MFSDLPDLVDFNVTQCCNEMVITWTAIRTNQSCSTTGYNIAIGNNTIIVPANQTSYTQPISDSECGSTIQISMSATNVAGTGNVTTINHYVVCTRECCITKLCFFMNIIYTQLISLNWVSQYSTICTHHIQVTAGPTPQLKCFSLYSGGGGLKLILLRYAVAFSGNNHLGFNKLDSFTNLWLKCSNA